jgi:hypothetical protein
MRKILAISELLLGGVLGLGVLILFASMAGISTPIWTLWFFLYWGGLIAGPLLIVIGASLTLFGVALKRAAVMMRLGSGILSCWAVYLVIGLFQEMAHRSLNTSLLSIMIAIVFIVLLSNFAAYKIYGLAAKTS